MIQMTLIVNVELEVKVPVGIKLVVFIEVWILVRIKVSLKEQDLVGDSSDKAFIVEINALTKALTDHLFNAYIGILTGLQAINVPLFETPLA